jgi:hypothetical protein
MQAHNASALVFLLLQGTLVRHKHPQVDDNHGQVVIFLSTLDHFEGVA